MLRQFNVMKSVSKIHLNEKRFVRSLDNTLIRSPVTYVWQRCAFGEWNVPRPVLEVH